MGNQNKKLQLAKNIVGGCGFFGLIALFGTFALVFLAFYGLRHGF